jgi:endoglucanase
MLQTRLLTTNRAFALLSLLAIAACGGSPTDPADALTVTDSDTRDPLGAAPSGPDAPARPGRDATLADTTSDGPTSSPPAANAGPGLAPGPMPYRGINLAGAQFGGALPGVDGKDYGFPTASEVDYYLSKGMSTFRIGFTWERLQSAAYGELDTTYGAKLRAIVSYATSKGATVIVSPHNFARYYGVTVGSAKVPSAVFADFWRRLSSEWGSNPNVMFNLVNEPHDIPTEQWVDAANAAIAAIRKTGATNVVVVPGNGWTGAHSWASSAYGTPNTIAMLKISDPADNVVFEAHQYMDATSGGSNGQCVSTTVGTERLEPFVTWLRDNKLKGMIGELAGGKNATCYAAVKDMLTSMMANSDVLVGWQWWAGGARWGSYEFSLEPSGGADQPQMTVLAPFLTR